MKKFILLLLLAIVAAEPLNVFIIPHSHCDPGWLNTFEGYFRDQVNRILTGVTEALYLDTTKKFVWAEISFFNLWYEQQGTETRETVKTIVSRGQLEFVAGGWVQNDEANANFDIVIDQITEGHDFLARVFGVVPRVAWQIDPFGHSSLTPSLFSRMGFEALVINRIHYGLKASFKDSKSMEFLWTGSQSLGNQSEIFTHVLHTHYSAPQTFDWEEGGSPHISKGNVQGRSRELVNTLKARSNAYRTNNLLVTFGDDFKFQNPGVQFSNMDQIISEINSNSDYNVKIQYGTVSEYFDAVNKAAKTNKIQFPTYSGDFFPYADNEDAYWTGYYTSRPILKGHSRNTDSIIKAAEGMYAMGRIVSANGLVGQSTDWINHFSGIRQARRDAALVQHHDGITGTAKQFVADDYSRRLDQAHNACGRTITEMAEILLTDKESPSLKYDVETFSFDNGDEAYAIVVHNPLGWMRRKYISLTVSIPDVTITTHEGIILDSQIVPIVELTSLEPTSSRYELYFLAEVPPLGLTTFFLSKAKSSASSSLSSDHSVFIRGFPETGIKAEELGHSSKIEIENEHLKVTFSGTSGLIESVHNKDTNDDVTLKQELLDYTTSRSGAYIMRPDSQVSLYGNSPTKLVKITGSLVSVVCTYFYANPSDSAFETSVCVKVFSTRGIGSTPNVLEVGGFLEVTYSVVGRRNRETVARFNTDLSTGRGFFTDNGLEIRQRQGEGPRTESKYYPNLSFAYLQDAKKGIQFTILSRQAMGTHSRDEGMLEQMLHRALAQDDGRGLAEPNNDHSRIEVQVYLLVQPLEPSVRMARRLALALQHQPRMLHTEAPGGAKSWGTKYKHTFFPLNSQLPHNVHLLSFKARDSVTDDYIFRVLRQHDQYSQEKEIEWDKIFTNFKFESKRERSLAMSRDVEEAQERRPRYQSGEKLDHASGISPHFVKQESQNTQEEGVFISQAALDDKAKVNPPAAPPLPRNNNNNNNNNNNPTGRKLQALSLIPNDAVIMLEPMQIKSYYVQFSSNLKQYTTTENENPYTAQAEPEKPQKETEQQKPPKETKPIDQEPPKTQQQQQQQQQQKPPKDSSDDHRPPQTPPTTEVLKNDKNDNGKNDKNNKNNKNQQHGDDDHHEEETLAHSQENFLDAAASQVIVSELELKAFLVISVLGTGLIVLAYSRLRRRSRANRKKIIEV